MDDGNWSKPFPRPMLAVVIDNKNEEEQKSQALGG